MTTESFISVASNANIKHKTKKPIKYERIDNHVPAHDQTPFHSEIRRAAVIFFL